MTSSPDPLPLRWAVPAAIGSGAALWLAFPTTGWWPLALAGVALLSVACLGQRARVAFMLGTTAGLVFYVPLLDWLVNVGVHAWLVLAVSQALATGLLAVGLSVTWRLRWWPVAHAALWVLYEAVRGRWPFGGFTWGRLAFSQTRSPLANWVAVGGAPLLTLATALAGLALLWAALRLRRTTTARVALAAAVPLALMVAGLAIPAPTGASRSATVAAVQGNVPDLGLDAFGEDMAVVRNHAQATALLAERVADGRVARPDLVVWPENSTDIDPRRDQEVGALVDDAVARVGVPVLVGAVLDTDDGHILNAGLVWDPQTGPGRYYVKQHLVPYGEYVPFRQLLAGRIRMLEDYIPRDFVAGSEPGVLDVGGVRLGDAICFEVAYDALMRETVRSGAQLLVVQTNNATYMRGGNRAQTEQQLEMGRLRAIEHGRAVVVAATSGVSALIAPDGRTIARSGVFTQDELVGVLPLRSSLTVADRVGAWPELLVCLLAIAAVVVAVRRRRGDRVSRRPAAPAEQTMPELAAPVPAAGAEREQ
jgi:apolipoprotein N-acyltransferase